MRLFIASEVYGITKDLRAIQDRLRQLPAKQTFPSTYHVTYQFLGEVQPEDVEKLKKHLSGLVFNSISCKVTGIQWFPQKGDIRVVWAQVAPVEPLQQLQRTILEAIGQKPQKKFIPHITLSRVKKFENKRAFKDGLLSIKTSRLVFEINEVKLIQSILSPQGPKYRGLCTIQAQQYI